MNVGIDASRAAMCQPTGTEHYSWRLINALLRLPHKNRYRLYLRERPPDGHFFAAPHAEQVVMPFPRLWTHVRLSAEVLLRPPDVLFVPAHVLPLVHPRNSVVTVMDLGHRHYPEAHPWRDRLYLEWSTRRNAHRASRIIAISGATRDDLIRSYGTDPAKITVIYPGIDEEIAREEDPGRLSEVRMCYGLPDSYLLYIGTLHPRKNLVRVIHAFGRMLSEWPPESGLPPALVLAGKKGWHYDRIFAEARDLGLENHVIFLGYVPQHFLLPLLSGARAFVFPSLFEGFGFPVLEAMACQVPVVTSRASCLPEVAGDAALLVDPHDEAALARAMTRVSVDSDLRSVLIERGIRRVREFTWERCAGETMAVLEKPNAR